jgi:hypothetical protein
MGAGANALFTGEEQQKASDLVTTVQTKSGNERVLALKELWSLSDSDKYKESLCDPSFPLLATLRSILESDDEEAHLPATGIIWYLSRIFAGKVRIGSSEVKLIPVLIPFLSKSNESSSREHVLKTFVNLLMDKRTHSYVSTPEFGFFQVIFHQICANPDNFLLYYCIANFATESTAEDIQLLIYNDFHQFMATKLFAGKPPWTGYIPEEQCLRFFTKISVTATGADAIRAFNKPDFFTQLMHSDDFERVYATMILANVYGKDENTYQTKALLISESNILELILSIMDYTLHSGGNNNNNSIRNNSDNKNNNNESSPQGYLYGRVGLREISSALKSLSISDENKKMLVNYSKLLDFSAEVIQSYLKNSTAYTGWCDVVQVPAGGGGEDLDSFENLVEFLLQLSYYYEDDESLQVAFQKCSFDLKTIIKEIMNLPAERNCPFESRHLAVLLYKRLDSTSSTAENIKSVVPARPKLAKQESIRFSEVTPTQRRLSPTPLLQTKPQQQQHIMLSYSWSKNKSHVIALGKKLREVGYEIWRDEEGSNLLPSMQGDIEDSMAEAIQRSYAMIVFVSSQYKESVNCRAEAKYARAREANGFLRLIYVMVDENYHTRSSPRAVDGWLGFMVGSDLWYPLWTLSQLEQTAKGISELIGENAKTTMSSELAAPVITKSENNSQPMKKKTEEIIPVAAPVVRRDFETGWTLLSDPSKAKDSKAVSNLLDEYGVCSAEDFAELEEEHLESLAVLLKFVPQKYFRRALNLQIPR